MSKISVFILLYVLQLSHPRPLHDNNEAVLKLPTNDGCTVNIKATNLIGSAKVCEGSEDSTIIINVDSFTKAEKISSMPVVVSYKEKFRVSSSSNDGLGKYFIGDHKKTGYKLQFRNGFKGYWSLSEERRNMPYYCLVFNRFVVFICTQSATFTNLKDELEKKEEWSQWRPLENQFCKCKNVSHAM